METNITLKEKCKFYQKRRDYIIPSDGFIICHIDGRSFSKMIKNKFEKPFDVVFIYMMNKTAEYLCQMVQGVHLAYTQSDEITLIIKKNTEESDVFFGGRLCKMQSIIASLATAKFNQLMTLHKLYGMQYDNLDVYSYNKISTLQDAITSIVNTPLYEFDCKVWDVDNANDAMAWLLFRNIDCVRNSKQQTAQTYLPHKELLNKSADEQVALLLEEKGVNWFDLPDGQKYGRLILKQMVTEERTFSTKDGIERTESCVRSKWQIVDGFDLTVSANREKITEMYPIFKDEGTI